MDWITGWGAAYEAMLVLDADSLMTGTAINRLADELSTDPAAGLIQSFPMLIGAETVFARLQQFSNIAYGWLLAEGLAKWAKGEGNYWGHNAIIRTRAFAASAGLPHLRARDGSDELIMSHDFVEAGLLRRAGWRVEFLPRVTGSYEETPGTLIDYVLRDQRWCRGNLQHLRLLGTAGLHPVSRFHMFHGAVAYLLSPAWFCLLIFWALLGKDAETNVIRYFNEANPLFPNWPPAMSYIDSAVFLVIMYAMLLTPKLVGAGIIARASQGHEGLRRARRVSWRIRGRGAALHRLCARDDDPADPRRRQGVDREVGRLGRAVARCALLPACDAAAVPLDGDGARPSADRGPRLGACVDLADPDRSQSFAGRAALGAERGAGVAPAAVKAANEQPHFAARTGHRPARPDRAASHRHAAAQRGDRHREVTLRQITWETVTGFG